MIIWTLTIACICNFSVGQNLYKTKRHSYVIVNSTNIWFIIKTQLYFFKRLNGESQKEYFEYIKTEINDAGIDPILDNMYEVTYIPDKLNPCVQINQ